MGLFNRFRDTVIYKEDNELENKIRILKELREKYPENDKIKNDLKLAEIGLKGEKNIEFELKNANIGMYVLHDITLRYEDLVSQIDYIVITPARNYFIECKNIVGKIIVDENGNFERKSEYFKDKSMYSPLTQAERHINIFIKGWRQRHGKLDNFLYEKYLDKWNIPLVVIANDETILDVKKAPSDIKNKIIKHDQLIRYLKNDIKSLKKSELTTQKDMKKIADGFLELNDPVKIDYEKLYITEVETLKNKLLEFRSKKAKERIIPEDYIFTNEELDNILKKLPKLVEDLTDILPEVKQKLHGQEIIDIIKENMQ